MNKIVKDIKETIGEKFFTDEDDETRGIPKLAQNNARRVVIGIVRETVGPFINRSSYPDETIGFKIMDEEEREVVEVPARKFKSKEKLLALRYCKLYNTDDLNIVDPNYRYNSLDNIEYLSNPVSVIFGDTVVKGGSENEGKGMLPSRILYSSSYSIRDRSDITRRLTHNALSENGTMWDEKEGKNRTSLFETEYVIPGVYFPSFLTLIDPTPESLFLVLKSLKQNSYGASTAVTGSNIRNNIVFIAGCTNEPPLSSYLISRDWFKEDNPLKVSKESITDVMIERENDLLAQNERLVSGKGLIDFINRMDKADQYEVMEVMRTLKKDSEKLLTYSKIINPKR